MVVPNVMLALWRYHQRNRIEMRHALPLASMGFCFAWLGSIWAVGIDAQSMRIGFVAFMIVLAAYNLIRMFAASVQASTQMRYGWPWLAVLGAARSEEHTSELQSLMRTSYAVFCLKNKNHMT